MFDTFPLEVPIQTRPDNGCSARNVEQILLAVCGLEKSVQLPDADLLEETVTLLALIRLGEWCLKDFPNERLQKHLRTCETCVISRLDASVRRPEVCPRGQTA